MLKRGLLFLLVFFIFLENSLAQEPNQCLLVNEANVDEAANKIWNVYSRIKTFEGDNSKILEATLSAVDSLKAGDNGYGLKEELKDYLKSISLLISKGYTNEEISSIFGGYKELLNLPYKRLPSSPLYEIINNLISDEIVHIDPIYWVSYEYGSSQEPSETLEIMKRSPLFLKIYENPRLPEEREISIWDIFDTEFNSRVAEKVSIALSVYRKLVIEYKNPTYEQINEAIDYIMDKRTKFENTVILGPETYFLGFVDVSITSVESLSGFVKNMGAREDSIITSSNVGINEHILNSKDKGKTTIWFEMHGNPFQLLHYAQSREGGTPKELAEVLLARGRLDEVIIVLVSCYSYDYAKNLLNRLRDLQGNIKNPSYPTIIVSANKNKEGEYYAFQRKSVFLSGLLFFKDEGPLLGKDIYILNEKAFHSEDLVVFFSEDGISPSREITMDSLNPSECGICEGDSCPIQSVQGISS